MEETVTPPHLEAKYMNISSRLPENYDLSSILLYAWKKKNYGKIAGLKATWDAVIAFCRGKYISETIFAEKLAYFKQNEKPEVVLLIADNPELIKIIITWTSIDMKCAAESTQPSSDSEKEAWEWLWQNTKFSLNELKEKADIPFAISILEMKMKPLIGNRILYPDGTVNSYVQRYLKERVVRLFEAKPKRPVKKE